MLLRIWVSSSMSSEDGDDSEAVLLEYGSAFGEQPCLICGKIYFGDEGAFRFCDDCFVVLEVDEGMSLEEMRELEERLSKERDDG